MKWCEWFALCDRPADFTSSVVGLGDVPVCARCAKTAGIAPAALSPLPLVPDPATAPLGAGTAPS